MSADVRNVACGRVRGRIEALCDRSLAPLDLARDEGHVEACAECARLAERQREVVQLAARSFDAAELAFGVARAGLDERIARARSPHVARWTRQLQAASLAAAALLALALLHELGLDARARGALASLQRLPAEAPVLDRPRLPEARWR